MNIKYFVRTTGHRRLDSSYNQINFSLLTYTDRRPIDDFIKSLYEIAEYDAVLLEDDLILCDNFEEELKAVLEKYPHRIINFFQNPTLCSEVHETSRITYNQCTFYPKGIAKEIADIMSNKSRITDSRDPYIDRYSVLEQLALKELNIKIIQYRPHLVQHLDLDTTLRHNMLVKRSYFFIDYYKQLGITDYSYEAAKKYFCKLFKLCKEQFKKIDENKSSYFN